MSKADDYYSVVTEVNEVLNRVFNDESAGNAWFFYPCYKGLNGDVPATNMRKGIEKAREVLKVLKELEVNNGRDN